MAINAFKNGLTVLDENNLNQLLTGVQPFRLFYDGTQRAASAGTGVVENSIAEYSYCVRFTLTNSMEIDRVELEVDRDGQGADLVVQIRSGMNPTGGIDGTLLKQVVVPKEFIPDPRDYFSVLIGLSGLTSGGQYWLVVQRTGDSTHKVDWIGETSQDENYPAYRRYGDSGNWSTTNALHFKVFSGVSGLPRHVIEGQNAVTSIYYAGDGIPLKIYQYIPPADGPQGGIRDMVTMTYQGGLPVKGE